MSRVMSKMKKWLVNLDREIDTKRLDRSGFSKTNLALYLRDNNSVDLWN